MGTGWETNWEFPGDSVLRKAECGSSLMAHSLFMIFPPKAVEPTWRADALPEQRPAARASPPAARPPAGLPIPLPGRLQPALQRIPAEPLHAENGASLLFRPEQCSLQPGLRHTPIKPGPGVGAP